MPIVRKAASAEEFEKLIERYKIQNPVKFALKEKALMAKLAGLKQGSQVEGELEMKPKKK